MTSAIAQATVHTPRSNAGHGSLAFHCVAGRTVVSRARAHSPLRLLTPSNPGRGAWVFASTYGGGLVAGDRIAIDVNAGPDTLCYLGTQSSTKVYRNSADHFSGQELCATLSPSATLISAPDPLVCFADTHYRQRQTFHLDPTSNLIALDWFTSGRIARGEHWHQSSLSFRTEIFRNSPTADPAATLQIDSPPTRRLLLDNLRLDSRDAPLAAPFRLANFHCFATLIILGPALTPHAQSILQQIAALPQETPNLLVSASPLAEGLLLRLAAPHLEPATHFLFNHLSFLREILGEHPWQRKW